MCRKMAGKHIVSLLAILALSKSFSEAKSTNTKLSVGTQISASNNQKDDDGSDDSLLTDVDERKRCHCDKLIPDLKPDYQPVQYDQPNEFDLEDWPEKLGIPSAFDSSGSISISGSIGSSGGIKHKPQPILQDSSDSSNSIEPSVPSLAGFVEEPEKKPQPNLDFPKFQIPEISSEPLESKPIQPVSFEKEIEKPRPVKKQVEKKQSKTTITYSKTKKVSSTAPTKTTGVQGLTCPNV